MKSIFQIIFLVTDGHYLNFSMFYIEMAFIDSQPIANRVLP